MNPRGIRSLLLLITGLLVLAIVCTSFQLEWSAPSQGRQFTAGELRKLLQDFQIASGYVENYKFAEAEEALTGLLARVPDEPSITRNLAISRLLAFENDQIAWARVEPSLQALERVAPDSAATYWLRGRAHKKAREISRAPAGQAQHLRRAVQAFDQAILRAPENAAFRWDVYETTRYARDAASVRRAQRALSECYRLAAGNFFVLTEWLLAAAKSQDAGIAEPLKRLRDTIAPLAAGIERRTRIGVIELITAGIEAAAAEDWSLALQTCRKLMSVVRSEEICRSDHRQISLNALGFIEHDFAEPLRRQVAALAAPQPDPIDVHWRETGGNGHLSQLDDVRDVMAVDIDLDQLLEIVVLRTTWLEVYSQRADGWQRVLQFALDNQPRRVLSADLDRDTFASAERGRTVGEDTANDDSTVASERCFEADVELVILGARGVVVLENSLDAATKVRSLLPVTQPAELTQLAEVVAACLLDFDHDGDLDLALATATGLKLWSNRDNLTFEDVTSWSLLPPAEGVIEWMVAVDWDRDVDTDILCGGSSMDSGFLENLRHGHLRWQPFEGEFAVLGAATDLAVLDADRNAAWDLVAAQHGGLTRVLTESVLPGVTQHLKSDRLPARGGQSIAAFDYDNDGWQDLVLSGAEGVSLFRGIRGGEFEASLRLNSGQPTQRCVPADLDNDGDLDLMALSGGTLRTLTNEGGNRNRWLKIRVRGEEEARSGRVNHNGIGSLVEMKAGNGYQARVVTAPVTHFGLGDLERADVVRVLFTNGIPQSVIRPRATETICEKMMLKGSCPYLYTWDGRRFVFYTDLLWAAPLGLQLSAGVIAKDRAWEYLKIEGQYLQPQDGAYVLQVTEELWEAAYFDQVELIVVDHPASVEIFSNEKVGPPSIAEFKLHTVGRRRHPLAARDSRGRDVLDPIRQRDGVYLRAFDRTLRQGLTESHYLELDLGQLSDPQQITLFLTGWIRPTDTSLNVALTHNPELSPPRLPAIWVPNREGDWQEVIPFMGFPGGKTKTIAIDLSRAFLTADYRLRIASTAELYWDEVFFTVDELPAEVQLQPLELVEANLHFRGFSHPQPAGDNAPQTYIYDAPMQTQRWPPMQGHFTKYGDVRELLVEVDDRHVILASGDELTLRFELPKQPLRPGWSRDFILHNVGWDKDADLNTIYGQSVEPLPFAGMSAYPFAPGESYPQTKTLRRYRSTRQTRTVPAAAFWKQILRYGMN